MSLIILAALLALSLFLIPFGLPGTWLMVAAAVGYNALAGGKAIGWVTLAGIALLALGAELADIALAGRYAKKYGGSRRASWGAVIGGMVGAIVGVPVPIIGSVIGGFLGAFVGAWVGERLGGAELRAATRVAQGALIGRVVAAAMKVAVGCVIAAWVFFAALA